MGMGVLNLTEKILKLYSKKQFNELEAIGKDQTDFNQLLRKCFDHVDSEAKLLHILLKHCFEKSTNQRVNFCKALFEYLLTVRISSNTLQLCLETFIDFLRETSHEECLTHLSKHIISICSNECCVENPNVMQLFPEIMSSFRIRMSIEKHKKLVASYLSDCLDCQWAQNKVLSILTFLCELDLSNEDGNVIVEKALSRLCDMDLEEIPPLIYRIHFLILKVSDRRLFYPKLIKSLSQLNLNSKSNNVAHVYRVQATCIVHICHFVHIDSELSKLFVKLINSVFKNQHLSLSYFLMGLTLSFNDLSRHDVELVNDVIKPNFLKNLKCLETKNESNAYDFLIGTIVNFENIINEVITICGYGWDSAVEGLVALGLGMIDSYSPKRCAFAKEISYFKPNTLSTNLKACFIGCNILKRTFKLHSISQDTIVDELLHRLFTKATDCPVYFLIELLNSLIRINPTVFLENLNKMKEWVNNLFLMPWRSCFQFFLAIKPLIKINFNFRDNYVLVMKKCLFSRNLDARRASVMCSMHLLKDSLHAMSLSQCSLASSLSLSQVTVDIHVQDNSRDMLQFEVLTNLKRALSQQSSVREIFYNCIGELLRSNSFFSMAILQILIPHVKCFLDFTQLIPININQCIKQRESLIEVIEPLPFLFSAIQQIIMIVTDIPDSEDAQNVLFSDSIEILEKLSSKLCVANTSDLTDQYGCNFSNGELCLQALRFVVETFEVLLEYHLGNAIFNCNEILDIFHSARKFSALYKKSSLLTGFFISHSTLCSIVENIFFLKSSEWSDIIKDAQFKKFVMRSLIKKAEQFSEKHWVSGFKGDDSDSIKDSFIKCYKYLLNFVSTNIDVDEHANVVELSIEFMSVVLDAVKNNDFNVVEFVQNIIDSDSEVSDSPINACIGKFQEFIETFLEDESPSKVPLFSLKIIMFLAEYLEKDNRCRLCNWIMNVVTKYTTCDLILAKKFIEFLLREIILSEKDFFSIYVKICGDIHSKIGDINVESYEDVNVYKMIAIKNCNHVAGIVITHLADVLLKFKYIVEGWKSKLSPDFEPLSNLNKSETALCKHIKISILVVNHLILTSFPSGYLLNSVIDCVIHLFELLVAFSKFYISKFSFNFKIISNNFEELIKTCSSLIIKRIYDFITFFQASNSENSKPKKKKSKLDSSFQRKIGSLKELKSIPNLVFVIEQYEASTIQLGGVSKLDFGRFFKLSVNRDFRIMPVVREVCQQQQQTDDIDSLSGSSEILTGNVDE